MHKSTSMCSVKDTPTCNTMVSNLFVLHIIVGKADFYPFPWTLARIDPLREDCQDPNLLMINTNISVLLAAAQQQLIHITILTVQAAIACSI